MADDRYPKLYEKIQTALSEKTKRDALYRAMKRGRDNRAAAIDQRPTKDRFRKDVREAKRRCIENLDELLEQFVEKARERGAKVFLANTGEEAIQYTLEIVRQRQAKRFAKAKSLTSEEIGINHPLEEMGVEVIETDLGELIIQKVHEKPYHLVFPAVHKTAADVARIFSEVMKEPVPDDVQEIMKYIRRYLRPIFLTAEIGMTGANAAIAENGALVIETNEGNARLVSSIPDCHVCIMGREKIVETVEDALLMCLAHPISAVGQLLTTYVTFMGGRSELGQGVISPRESHIIILDNGRTAMRRDSVMKDALYCIRCGACMNICPTYGVVGGHTFGYIYPGPIGIPWTAMVHSLEYAGDFAPLCISCGLCKEICPANIDIPMMIAEVKHRDAERHGYLRVNKVMMAAESFSRFGSLAAPLSNWFMTQPWFRALLEKVNGVDRRRQLPPFHRQTFQKWFHKRKPPVPAVSARRKVAYFVDLYANYNDPEIGIAAVETLEALGCQVIVPPQKSSGYPYIGYGNLAKAKKLARENVAALLPFVREGYDVVTTEPTAAYCLKVSYPKLLEHDSGAEVVAKASWELFAYLDRWEKKEGELDWKSLLPSLEGKRFGFHVSCHQRPLSSGTPVMQLLRRCGARVDLIETGTCCGMGGTFGMKKGMLGYDLANAVGEPLFQLFKESGVEAIVTESSVCRIQLLEGTGIPVWHPLKLLRHLMQQT